MFARSFGAAEPLSPDCLRRQPRRPRGQVLGIRLDCFHDLLDCTIQLRIFATDHLLRPVFDNNVRLNASVLHYPLALIVITGKLGPSNVAAIHKREFTSNAANTAPGALSNERAQFVIFEHVAEEVTVRGSVVIGQAYHGAIEDDWWHRTALPVAR